LGRYRTPEARPLGGSVAAIRGAVLIAANRAPGRRWPVRFVRRAGPLSARTAKQA